MHKTAYFFLVFELFSSLPANALTAKGSSQGMIRMLTVYMFGFSFLVKQIFDLS